MSHKKIISVPKAKSPTELKKTANDFKNLMSRLVSNTLVGEAVNHSVGKAADLWRSLIALEKSTGSVSEVEAAYLKLATVMVKTSQVLHATYQKQKSSTLEDATKEILVNYIELRNQICLKAGRLTEMISVSTEDLKDVGALFKALGITADLGATSGTDSLFGSSLGSLFGSGFVSPVVDTYVQGDKPIGRVGHGSNSCYLADLVFFFATNPVWEALLNPSTTKPETLSTNAQAIQKLFYPLIEKVLARKEVTADEMNILTLELGASGLKIVNRSGLGGDQEDARETIAVIAGLFGKTPFDQSYMKLTAYDESRKEKLSESEVATATGIQDWNNGVSILKELNSVKLQFVKEEGVSVQQMLDGLERIPTVLKDKSEWTLFRFSDGIYRVPRSHQGFKYVGVPSQLQMDLEPVGVYSQSLGRQQIITNPAVEVPAQLVVKGEAILIKVEESEVPSDKKGFIKIGSEWFIQSSKSVTYDLSQVLIHNGGTGGGHWTGYFKVAGKWYFTNDTSNGNNGTVVEASESEVLAAAAKNARSLTYLPAK